MSPGRSRPLPPPAEDEAKKIPDCETLVYRRSDLVRFTQAGLVRRRIEAAFEEIALRGAGVKCGARKLRPGEEGKKRMAEPPEFLAG
jgi:hypothetical protein